MLEKLNKKKDKVLDMAYANCRVDRDCNQLYYLHVTQRNEWHKEGLEPFRRQYDPNVLKQSP